LCCFYLTPSLSLFNGNTMGRNKATIKKHHFTKLKLLSLLNLVKRRLLD
jgi:hypothetical protein